MLDSKAGEITLNAYVISSKEIIESYLNIGSGASLMISSYIFGLIWGKTVFTYSVLIVRVMKVIYLKTEVPF